jgi:hypothetical protein
MESMSDSPFKKPMTLTDAQRHTARTLLALTAASLLTLGAQAQTATPAAPAASQADTAPAPAAASAPKYSATDIERAFNFMDANKDGKISREEAAGFRGVARHFDEADTNKDGFLSREEFESALNGSKSR